MYSAVNAVKFLVSTLPILDPFGDGLEEAEGVVVVDDVSGAELEDVLLFRVLGLGCTPALTNSFTLSSAESCLPWPCAPLMRETGVLVICGVPLGIIC
jgi:hypothetical protein